ncbi:MAG: UDP-N-acetylmuramate:L-alanyl-gamma-D-glutamyl-meso-diaminopimelate ligase [Nitrospirae bacterium]|nr:UDP-N-acetylmuramate:L-alanyl-gamma-D-glutamyl-meso-diaminopimelate ligase [Nitrospirota bacterium]
MGTTDRHIHLIAICGTGMAALAGMLKAAGYRVTGSDANVYPPMSTMLERQGISYRVGFRPENIEPDTDLVVIGNAVSKTNPEVLAVLERGLPYRSFPQALAEFFLDGRVPIVVAGTHGKTTTAALAAWVLDCAGLSPGFLIGGWVKNFDANSRPGTGRYFVVEGDEYDTAFFDKGPKFLHYRPHAAILTSIEFDHGDIYNSLDEIKAAFRTFVRLIPSDGMLLAAEGDPNVQEVIREASCDTSTYGLNSSGRWHAEEIRFDTKGVSFRVMKDRTDLGRFRSPLVGKHNLNNAVAVIGLAFSLGLSADAIQKGIESFHGVKRRQEVAGEVNGIIVMDDFAHHPTAIRETLAGLRLQYPGRRIWAIFEPRSATSRRNVFQREFPSSFEPADRIVIAGLFAPEKIPAEQRLDPKRVAEDLRVLGKEAAFIPTADEIVRTVSPQLKSGDLVCVMSSGGFDGIHGKLLKALAGPPLRQAG